MKKLYFFLFLAIFYAPAFSFAQNAEGLAENFSNSACSVSVIILKPISCNGACDGSAKAIPNGTAPFNYAWSPSGIIDSISSFLCAGTYWVHVTDSTGCVATDTVVFTQPPLLTSSIPSIGPTCVNGASGYCCVSTTGGTPPYTYQWSNGTLNSCATGLSAGTYCSVITDAHGCTDTLCVVMGTNPPINPSITKQDPSCSGCTDGCVHVNLGGGTAPYMYSWNTVPYQSTQTVCGLAAGTYIVCVTDGNGCMECDTTVLNDPGVLVSEINKEKNISIYPNPAHDDFSITIKEEMRNASVEIFNVMGEKIYASQFVNGRIFSLPFGEGRGGVGIYFVRVTSGEKIYSEKLIID